MIRFWRLTMVRIALRTMRARWIGFVGSFVATTLAVALVGAWGILAESAVHAPVRPVQLADAPIVVAAKQTVVGAHGNTSDPLSERVRLPSALAGRLAAVPGVDRAVPELSFPATLGSQQLTVRSWPGPGVAVGRDVPGAHPGGSLTLNTATGAHQLTANSYTDGDAILVPADVAADLSGVAGRVDAVGVYPQPGVSTAALAARLHQPAGSAQVLTGDDRGRPEFPELVAAKADLTSLSGAIAGVAIMVAAFVVAGTLAVSVQQRNRELALLRAVAATPWQIRRMIAVEGIAVALAAGVAGAAPAIGLAGLLRRLLVNRGIVPAQIGLHVTWAPLLGAAGGGLVVVLLAGIAAGQRASRVRPTAALAESNLPPRRIGIIRLLLGLGALAGGIVLLTQSLSMQGDDAAGASAGIVMILMSAVGLLGPILGWAGATLLGSPMQAVSSVGGFLAAVNSRMRTRRLGSAITPVALTVALAFITVFLQGMLRHESGQQGRHRLVADQVLQAPDTGVPPDRVRQIEAVSGVDIAVGMRTTQIEKGGDLVGYGAVGVTGGRLDRVLDLDVVRGQLQSLAPDQIALSAAVAAHSAIGDRISFRLGDGTPVTARLAAVYNRSLGLGDAVLPWSMVASHVDTPAPNTVLVRLRPGADAGAVTTAVHDLDPQIRAGDRDSYTAQQRQVDAENAWANYLLLGVIGGYAAVALVNTLIMTISERRREFALLQLIGATGRQVRQMVRWEAGLVALLGIGLGSAVGYATLVPFSRALGPGVTPYVPPLQFLVIAGAAAALAFSASLLSARRALALAPVEAAGLRE